MFQKRSPALHAKVVMCSIVGLLWAARTIARRLQRQPVRHKIVGIIGGSRGLGLDLARAFAAQGARVALCARDPDEVKRALADLRQRGALVMGRACDATHEPDMKRFVEDVQATWGEMDVLITCAATIQIGPAELMLRSDYEDAFKQIFWSTYLPTMAVLPQMRKRKRGHLVHVTSFGGNVPVPHLLPYSTAKFAVTGFSAGLRTELAKDGICVTTIAPPVLRTGAHVNVPVKGQHAKELTWFSLGATLPLLSLSSTAAARKIVAAVEQRDAQPSMGIGTRLASIVFAAAPGLMARLLQLFNSLLPSATGGSSSARPAHEIFAETHSPLLHAIDTWGYPNAVQHNQYPPGMLRLLKQ